MKITLDPADFPDGYHTAFAEKALAFCFTIEVMKQPDKPATVTFIDPMRGAGFTLVGPIDVELALPTTNRKTKAERKND